MRVSAGAAGLLLAAICLAPPGAHARDTREQPRLLPLPAPPGGLSFGLNWNADIYDNLDGGARTGHATDSVLSANFGLDTGALGWWQGGQFALGLQAIASTHPSEYVGDLQTLSNLDAPNQRHVSEFWYSQNVGIATVRGGIMDMNRYFDVTDAAGLFPNSSFGIIPSISANVPASIYPDFGWGVMARLGPDNDDWLIGAYQGNPVRRSSALHDGVMAIAERDWRAPQNHTHIGIGAWYRQVPESGGAADA